MIKHILVYLSILVPFNVNAMVTNGQIIQQSGNGRFQVLNPDDGFTVGADNFDTYNLYAFDENQNIILSEPIRVDIGGNRGVLAQGTEIASHYVFFDSLDGIQYGYVDFDAPILGVATQPNTMGATDFLAQTNVTYIGEDLRGLEEGDDVWIDANLPTRLWVYWAGSSPGDYVRVFTERSPTAALS